MRSISTDCSQNPQHLYSEEKVDFFFIDFFFFFFGSVYACGVNINDVAVFLKQVNYIGLTPRLFFLIFFSSL